MPPPPKKPLGFIRLLAGRKLSSEALEFYNRRQWSGLFVSLSIEDSTEAIQDLSLCCLFFPGHLTWGWFFGDETFTKF